MTSAIFGDSVPFSRGRRRRPPYLPALLVFTASAIDRSGRRKERRFDAGALRELSDDRHVLLPRRQRHRRLPVVALHHHRAAKLQHPRTAGAFRDELQHLLCVEAGLHRQHHGFSRRDVVNRNQQIGDELDFRSVTERSHVVVRPGESVQHVRHASVCGTRTAGVHDDVLVARLRTGAADRTIEELDALLPQRHTRTLLHVDRQCARLDDDRRSVPGLHQCINRLRERV